MGIVRNSMPRCLATRWASRRVPADENADGMPTPATFSSAGTRSEEHTSELQSRLHLVCRLLLEKKKKKNEQLLHVLHARLPHLAAPVLAAPAPAHHHLALLRDLPILVDPLVIHPTHVPAILILP